MSPMLQRMLSRLRTRLLARTRGAALALALAAGAGAAPSLLATTLQAQDLPEPGDGFAWEGVGDFPVDADALAFDADGTLWAAGDELWRLDLSGGPPGTWVVASGFLPPVFQVLLPLGRDTLVTATAGSTRRSLDGGATWGIVYDEGGRGLYEVPPGHPAAGRVLTGNYRSIAYSDDRAASFAPSSLPLLGTLPGGANAFAVLPPEGPFAGRLLAAARWGASYSDDGGETFTASARWSFYEQGHEVVVVERAQSPGGVRALMIGQEPGLPDFRAWVSDDGGETWLDRGGFPEGPPVGPGSYPAGLFALGGESALAVHRRGTVYRTDDAGETWAPVGRAPDISESIRASAAAVGPDGRLYVGLHRGGPARAWVYRTGEVVVSSEGRPPPGEGSLGVEVRPNPSRGGAEVVVTLVQPAEVEAVLYDALGRRVAVIAAGTYAAGTHALRVEASELPAGVYVVRVTAHPVSSARAEPRGGADRGETVLARRLTLVR